MIMSLLRNGFWSCSISKMELMAPATAVFSPLTPEAGKPCWWFGAVRSKFLWARTAAKAAKKAKMAQA